MQNTECRDHGCHCECHTGGKVRWGGVVAGALVAVGLSFLFHLLTIGIGFTGMLIWSLVGSFVIFFFSGSIAGRAASAHCERCCGGIVPGFLVWCLALLISIAMMTQIAEAVNALVKAQPVITIVAETAGHAVEAAVHQTGILSLSTFALFVAGALGAALGGCCGAKRCRKAEMKA
jgi:hypothetical protein